MKDKIARNLWWSDVLNDSNIRIIRPSLGLAPKYWPEVLGKTLTEDVRKGDALAWSMIDNNG